MNERSRKVFEQFLTNGWYNKLMLIDSQPIVHIIIYPANQFAQIWCNVVIRLYVSITIPMWFYR